MNEETERRVEMTSADVLGLQYRKIVLCSRKVKLQHVLPLPTEQHLTTLQYNTADQHNR